jgi:nitronate monooxygenase
LQEFFGIERPIVQAPMAGVQDSALAIAVSEAGGLGSLPCALLDHHGMRRELAAIREATDKPFNVNFFCHRQPAVDQNREARWRAALEPYYHELGVDLTSIPAGLGRNAFDEDSVAVLREFEPPVVSFHFGLPAPEVLDLLRAWGPRILSSATTLEEAEWLQSRGVDAVIAQGVEAGGHRSIFLSDDISTQIGTMALVPQVAAAVDVPVIAAGGIADARGVAAAMSLGAAGAQVGTAYLLCTEAKTSPVHRAALKSDAARVTALTNVFTGRPARSIVNRIVRELGPMSDAAPDFPLATAAVLPLRSKAEDVGSADFTPLWAGQNVTGCAEIGAAELTRRLTP